jgi:hypothetical protein
LRAADAAQIVRAPIGRLIRKIGRQPRPKIRYGVVWRRGLVGEVVPRFIEYTKEQFQLTPGRNDRQ